MESGLGRISLKHLLLIPLLHDNQVNGIMEISSLNKIESFKIRLLEKLAENLASTVQIIHVGNRMKLLVDQLNSHTEELNAQQEEMKQNLEELQATQEEIDRIRSREKDRDKELLQQNEELLKRQEELKELKLKYSALQKKVSKTKS
jgi:chromosome segregation ATPase